MRVSASRTSERRPRPVVRTPVPVDVAARVRVRPRPISALGGQAILVRGRLLPGLTGRKVSLQGRENGRWQTLTSTRTRSAGRFVLRYVANAARQERIRVKFAGDHTNGRSTASVGSCNEDSDCRAATAADKRETQGRPSSSSPHRAAGELRLKR